MELVVHHSRHGGFVRPGESEAGRESRLPGAIPDEPPVPVSRARVPPAKHLRAVVLGGKPQLDVLPPLRGTSSAPGASDRFGLAGLHFGPCLLEVRDRAFLATARSF